MEDFVVTSSPHIFHRDNVPKIMYGVIIALIPTVLAGILFFGVRAVAVLVISSLTAIITEYLFQKIRKRPITINDGSALITGVLLGLTLPPAIPLWMAAVGAVVSIGLGKQVYGGLGSNIFNPALVGRAFLLITFPVAMTTWINVDGVASATPLNLMKMQGQPTDYVYLLLGNTAGSLGETSAIAIILGGVYLIYKNYIDWQVPAAYLGTAIVFSLLTGNDPVFHLLSGGLMLGAFFMATDMVTTPITRGGKIIFAVGAGILTSVIRFYGGYPEGVMFSILFMNAVTPIINRYTQPKMYGRVKTNG